MVDLLQLLKELQKIHQPSIHLNDELDPRCQTKCICLL